MSAVPAKPVLLTGASGALGRMLALAVGFNYRKGSDVANQCGRLAGLYEPPRKRGAEV